MSEVVKENDSIMKLLLTSDKKAPLSSATAVSTINALARYIVPTDLTDSKIEDDAATKLNNFYNEITGSLESSTAAVLMDHCYARPWNWRQDSNFLRPTKTLFIPKPPINKSKSTNPLAPLQEFDDVIDVEDVSPEPPSIYDAEKAKYLMEECERHAECARTEQGNEDWEESISRINWTPSQNRLFNKMAIILNSDYVARLAYDGVHNEPILRRTVIEKSVKRMRLLMASVSWNSKLIQWLNQLLMDNLSTSYLAVYLDILQTLKSKLPTFVDKMMYGPNSGSRAGLLSNENLFPLLKHAWDPVASSLNQDKPKKLPGNPVIVVVPTSPSTANSSQFRRHHKWFNLLTNLASVVYVHTNVGNSGNRMTMTNWADQMLATARTKVQEIRTDCPGRPIVLAGFNAGAALALQIAQLEPVLCVLCLGFSLLTAEGKRGDPDDSLLELQCPVLFVIGQCSHTSLQEDMEDLRERMRVETGLIVVGSADDYLRVNKKKKQSEGITQSVVDRCIVDEIGEFISGILLAPFPPQIRQSPTNVATDPVNLKRIKFERRRNNSNGSSIDSEPPSPTPRITRPGQNNLSPPSLGRPPGSKTKSKLEAKWAAQVAQGNLLIPSPPNSPPPLLTSITSDTVPMNIVPNEKSPPSLLPSTELSNKTSHKISADNTTDASPSSGIMSPASASKLLASNISHRSIAASNNLSNTLQGNFRTVSSGAQLKQQPGSGIKENLTLNTSTSAKLVSNTGRTIDLSKITVLNSLNPPKTSTSLGNVVLMPDGKIKSVCSTIKGIGSTPLMLPMTNKTKQQPTLTTTANRVNKYITSKKQLLGNTSPKPIKKLSCIPASLSTTLPAPTNLTSEDIMDLPIIFADDNTITDNTVQPTLAPITHTPQIVQHSQPPKLTLSNATGKFVFINKQVPLQSTSSTNIIIQKSAVKRSGQPLSVRTSCNPVKYAKIIISKPSSIEDAKVTNTSIVTKISHLSPEISIRKIEPPPPFEAIDIENELVAAAVPKPNFAKSDMKNVTIITKKPQDLKKVLEGSEKVPQTVLNSVLARKSSAENVEVPKTDLDLISFTKNTETTM